MAIQVEQRTLLDLERRFWDAMKAKDPERTEAMTDDGCIVVGAQGVSSIDRKTMAKLTAEGEMAAASVRDRGRECAGAVRRRRRCDRSVQGL
jgi:Domain of unknown function (DUF4440)